MLDADFLALPLELQLRELAGALRRRDPRELLSLCAAARDHAPLCWLCEQLLGEGRLLATAEGRDYFARFLIELPETAVHRVLLAILPLRSGRELLGETLLQALKLVPLDASGGLVAAQAAFLASAGVAERLRHPDIVAMHAAGTEGATGWSDTWMIATKAAHPNCMYKWMDYIISPSANAQVAEWFGEAPAQTLACEKTSDKNFCTQFHALDAAYPDWCCRPRLWPNSCMIVPAW